ncbi:protein lin-37 homolog isoform X2 [Ostrinia furnacalis]|uniref:protein lin-37 homolog isoform X1 n=1 Tax=Ostrinia furnacalis TaxID=93504 RepID=UPI00103F6021|nr:protein lin-37 homolog isoform X1 [Ostrinia furnacalis]XP_028177749.1 protein lin-37 homolog isoform X2 [Ostrinia furnacalis]
MPKRSRRLLTPSKKAAKQVVQKEIIEEENEDKGDKEVSTARGRLKGALLEVLDPPAEESDESYEPSPTKKERQEKKDSEEEYTPRRKSPVRQSYVLKLFDRSVDLSQFEENSPLYPICRAWMINQPKENYENFGQSYEEPEQTEESVELPGPEGPPVSRIPELLPEQKARNKDNINLNYREAPPPSREQLLRWHGARWAAVRQAWLDQAQRVEARYDAAQNVLNKININAL